MIKHAFDEVNQTLLTTCIRHCRVSFLPARSRDTKACFHSGPVTSRKATEIADSLLLIGRGIQKYSLATVEPYYYWSLAENVVKRTDGNSCWSAKNYTGKWMIFNSIFSMFSISNSSLFEQYMGMSILYFLKVMSLDCILGGGKTIEILAF